MKLSKLKVFLFLVLIMLVVVVVHNVPKSISEEDEKALNVIFGPDRIDAETLSFEKQIMFVDELVTSLHSNLVVGTPIAYNTNREPSELVNNSGGLCYDFSRTIEKYLMSNGFHVRHVSVYLDQGNFFNTISVKGVYSHALTEVKTKKGWMIVDSNLEFYAQDESGEVFAYKDLVKLAEAPQWKLPLENELSPFYSPNVQFVYGLYSRHGKFYKPYNFIPDYNLRELFYNF